MKKRIAKICLGLMMACAIYTPVMKIEATQVSNTEPAVVDIEKYEVEEGMLNPGEQITVNLSVKNNSTATDAKNAIVVFTSVDGALAPIYGDDNQVYIGTIPAGQTVNVEMKALVNQEYKANATQMKCTFAYTSGYTALSNDLIINIPTYVSGDLLSDSVIVAENATTGVNSLVSIRCKNVGVTQISDVKLILNGNILEGTKEIALPSIGAGKTIDEDYYVNFTQSGIQNLQVTYQYTDVNGNVCIVDGGEYKVNVVDKLGGVQNGAIVTEVTANDGMTAVQVMMLAAVAVAVVGITVGFMKKK